MKKVFALAVLISTFFVSSFIWKHQLISHDAWFISFVIIFAAILLMPNRADKRKCPSCAELIKKEAIVCKHCRKDVPQDTSITQAIKSAARLKEQEVERVAKLRGLFLMETGPDPHKIDVGIAVKKLTGLDSGAASKLVHGILPLTIKEDISKEEAEEAKKKLESSGAKVELRGFH